MTGEEGKVDFLRSLHSLSSDTAQSCDEKWTTAPSPLTATHATRVHMRGWRQLFTCRVLCREVVHPWAVEPASTHKGEPTRLRTSFCQVVPREEGCELYELKSYTLVHTHLCRPWRRDPQKAYFFCAGWCRESTRLWTSYWHAAVPERTTIISCAWGNYCLCKWLACCRTWEDNYHLLCLVSWEKLLCTSAIPGERRERESKLFLWLLDTQKITFFFSCSLFMYK